MQSGINPVLRALGLEEGGVLTLRKPAQSRPVGAGRMLEIAVGSKLAEEAEEQVRGVRVCARAHVCVYVCVCVSCRSLPCWAF